MQEEGQQAVEEVEPIFSFQVVNQRVFVQIKMPGATFAVMVKPELAIKAAGMLEGQAQLAKSNIVVAPAGSVPHLDGNSGV